ncbi:MAG: GumC family protein [Rhodothermales bacterium]
MAERPPFSEQYPNGSQRNGSVPPRNGSGGLYYPTQSDAEAQEISLHEVLEVVFKNKWIILICFVGVLAGAAVYTLKQDPEYEAESTIIVDVQQANPQLGEMLGFETFNRNLFNEIEIIRSRKIAMLVAEQIIDIKYVPGTAQTFSVLGAQGAAENALEVAQRLQGRIRVQPVTRGVDVVEIVAKSTIPEEAALIATLYAEQYVAYNREVSRSHVTASREFLDEVTDSYSEELRNTENELTAFLRSEQVAAPDEEARLLLSRVSDLQQQRFQTNLDLGMAQAEIRAFEAQIEQIRPGLAAQLASGAADNVVIGQLIQDIATLDVRIQNKYARNPGLRENPSSDPKLVEDLNAVAALRADLGRRYRTLVDGVMPTAGSDEGVQGGQDGALLTLGRLQQQIMNKQIEASTLATRSEIIDQQLNQLQIQLDDVPRKEVILGRLERDHETTEQLYIALEEKLQEARIAEQSELGYVDIVDEAILPKAPVRPRVRLNLMMGAVFGLLLGFGLAFARNAVDNKVRKPEDLRKRGHSVVGLIPNMDRVIRQDFKGREHVAVDGHEYSTRLLALLNPLSPVSEGYRRVRTNIQFSRPDTDTRTIMITSPSPSEGKTVTALNLAITMAQAGRRTLYVDADLRRPQGHRLMGMPREAGLVDLLFDSVPGSVERFATELDSYLYVIPAGRDVPNPAEVLGSRKMQKFLARWRQEFDVILIDTPPTLIVADALILAAQCDTTLVVCSAGETNWQAMERCAESLDSVGADVIGVLLNRFDAKAAYGGYKYGYGYGYEYGYGNYYYGSIQRGKRGKRVTRKV